MDPRPLANLFKRSNYYEPIASELSLLDYLYENCDEVLKEEIYKVVHDSSLNEKHDCNDVIINSINVNCVNDMQNYKLGDDDFVISTTFLMIMIGVMLLMILKIYLSLMMNMLLITMFAIILKVGLEECQL